MDSSHLTDRQRLTALAFSNLGHFVTHLMMLLYPTVVLSLGSVFPMTYGELLQLSLPGAILFGAAALPAGWLGDRWSTRGMMALFFFGIGGSAILTGLARSPLELAVGMGLIGAFAAIYHPVGIAMLVGVARSRGRALGLNGVFGNLGVAGAATVAGVLTTAIHWRAAFILPGLAAIAAGVLFLLLVRVPLGKKTAPEPGKAPERAHPDMWRVFWVLGLSTIAGGMVYQALSLALPKLFDDKLGLVAGSLVGVGGFVTVVYALGSMAQLTVGFLMDRLPLKPLFIVLNIVQIPFLLLATGLAGVPLLLTAQVMVALSMGTIPLPDMILSRYTPSRWRGTVYGARFVLALGVTALAVPMVALIRDHTGSFAGLLAVLAGLAAVGFIAALLLPRDRPAMAPVGGDLSPAAAAAE